MAKQKAAASAPSPEAREEVLLAIRRSDEPLTASQLAKLLIAPHKLSATVLGPILDEYVAAGTLHAIPSASAKGKPRYWDRDINTLGRAAVLEAVQRAEGPLTAKELSGQLVAPLKMAEAALTTMLKEYVEAGTLHAIPKATAKGKPRYWNRDALEFGRLAVLKALADKGPQTQAELKKGAKGLTATQFEQLFQSLLHSRAITPHPPLGKPAKALFGSRPPAPERYLKDVGVQLTKVIAQLTAANVPREEVRRALVQLIEAAGIPFGSTTAPRGETTPAEPASSADLIALMTRIEPGAERGALVTAGDLRRAARLDKSQFDRAVLDLARQGRLSLHRHDYAASLGPAERDELVTDGAGTYYVGMALRPSES